jgi:hypothetical protein
MGIAIAGCGDLSTAGNLGEPIYVMKAELSGMEIGEPEGEHRAIFGWASVGDGDYFDCLESTNALTCALRGSFESRLVLLETEAHARFPSGLDIPFHAFPKSEELLDRNGSVLAIGGMAIYDDRNLNGTLDPISEQDPAPVDRVVAESIFDALQKKQFPIKVALFREGPVHPAWNVFRDFYDCPPPPPGFSVGSLDRDLVCTVSRTDSLRLEASGDGSTARARCGGGVNNIDLIRSMEPVGPPPEGTIAACTDRGDLFFYEDRGNFCDQFNGTVYALKGCLASHCWDFSVSPPEWWPCPM